VKRLLETNDERFDPAGRKFVSVWQARNVLFKQGSKNNNASAVANNSHQPIIIASMLGAHVASQAARVFQ
jgi:hypothetical protein